jgi:hypothetical protein
MSPSLVNAFGFLVFPFYPAIFSLFDLAAWVLEKKQKKPKNLKIYSSVLFCSPDEHCSFERKNYYF